MNSSRRASSVSQAAGNGLFAETSLQQPGRRDTQQSAIQPQQERSSTRHASVRHSGRCSSASHGGLRTSRSSVSRGSTRGPRTGHADTGGLHFERVVCIDEEDGRDRTPKPLLAARPDCGHPASWGVEASWGGGGGAPAATASASGGQLVARVPSIRSRMGSEMAEAALDALPPGTRPQGGQGRGTGRTSMLHGGSSSLAGARESMIRGGALKGNIPDSAASSARGSIALPPGAPGLLPRQGSGCSQLGEGMAEPQLAADLLAALLLPERAPQAQQVGRQAPDGWRQRPKATRCGSEATCSRAVQVLAWELRAAAGEGLGEAASGGGQPHAAPRLSQDQNEPEADPEDEEAALLALQQSGAAPLPGGRKGARRGASNVASFPGSAAPSLSSSRRGSVADFRRMSSASGVLASEGSMLGSSAASSRRTSAAASDWTSFAEFLADGRGSMLGGASSFYQPGTGSGGSRRPFSGRMSVASASGGGARRGTGAPRAAAPPPPQVSAEAAASTAERRERAARQRALGRMPGLLGKLEAVEKAVLLNSRHAKLAQYHGVQPCCVQPAEPSPGDSPALAEPSNRQEEAGPGMPPGSELQAQGGSSILPAGEESSGGGSTGSGASHVATPPDASCLTGAPFQAQSTPGSSESSTPTSLASLSLQPAAAAELPLLWEWRSALSSGLPVTCLAWSPKAPHLLAVGYGQLQYSVSGTGLLAVWSLSRPCHPVWHVATPCGVSALAWSAKAPSTVAVGFFDGGVALYDVRSRPEAGGTAQPLVRAPPAGGVGARAGHGEPVWCVRCVPSPNDGEDEMLVTASSDGRVLQWKQAQGLEATELLQLKSQLSGRAPGQGRHGGQGCLGRCAGTTSLAFSAADPCSYLVGTEEGAVHRCSTAFSQQSEAAYLGHLAPVYQVAYSPFSPTHFLTASADCSVRMWSEASPRALATVHPPASRAEVADVAFSPSAATQFAAAAGDAVQLWDVERSAVAPAAQAVLPGARWTCLAYSQAAPVVAAGADGGGVCVFSVTGMQAEQDGESPPSREQQRQRLEDAVRQRTEQHAGG